MQGEMINAVGRWLNRCISGKFVVNFKEDAYLVAKILTHRQNN